MTDPDDWASYLDPETSPDERIEIRSRLDEEEAAALDRVGRSLGDEALWAGPPSGLRDSLMARARAERGPVAAESTPASTGDQADEPGGRHSRRRLGLLGGGLVATAAVIALALFAVRPADDVDVTTYQLAATELTPGLDATIDVRPLPAGVALTLHIEGLAPAEEGTYYAAWLLPESGSAIDQAADGTVGDGRMVGVGSFHWREGGRPIGLWSGVDTDRFPVFIVTLQEEDAPPVASDVVVMTGRLSSG